MSGNAATNARRKPTLSSAAAIGYVAAKKQEEMEAAVVGLQQLQHETISDQLTDLEEALDNNLLTQEEAMHQLKKSKIILIGGILAIVGVAMFFNFFYYRVVT